MELVHRLAAADPAVATACALGVGHAGMLGLAEAAKQRGKRMQGAQVLVAAAWPARAGMRPTGDFSALTLQAQQLLESELEADDAANALELTLINVLMLSAGGGAAETRPLRRRQAVLMERQAAAVGGKGPEALPQLVQLATSHTRCAYSAYKVTVFSEGLDPSSVPTEQELMEGAACFVDALEVGAPAVAGSGVSCGAGRVRCFAMLTNRVAAGACDPTRR